MVYLNDIKNEINSYKDCKKYKDALILLLNLSLKDKLEMVDIIGQLYSAISIDIQKANLNNNIDDVNKIYLDVYNNIPIEEKKVRNIILNEYEIANKKIKLESFPRMMELFLTSKCNLKCIMCGGEKEKYSLSDQEFEELLEIFPYLQTLSIRGGEVFFDNRLNRLLENAKKTKVKLEIITNGLLLNERNIDYLIDTHTNLAISIDSVNKETYESIRVGATFDKLISNLKLLNDLRHKKQTKISTILHMVVMKRNYKEIENVIKFAHDYEFDHMTIIPVQKNETVGENIFDYNVDNNIINELADKRDYFFNLAKKYGIFLHSRLPQKNFNTQTKNDNKEKNNKNDIQHIEKSLIYCHLPFKRLLVDNKLYKPRYICKNLDYTDDENIENSIIKKWNSNKMMKYRQSMILGEYDEICSYECLKNYYINSNRSNVII